MDRNSIIGLVLIFAIFFGFSWWNSPSEEEKLAYQNRMDSIALVKKELRYQDSINRVKYNQENQIANPQEEFVAVVDSSVINQQLQQKFGAFANSSIGENKIIKVKNEVMKLDFQSLGGRVRQAELINYQTNDSLPLILFKGDTAKFGFVFSAANRLIHTQDHHFQTYVDDRLYQGQEIEVTGEDSVTISMRLFPDASQGYNQHQYIEYAYTIYGNKYMYDFNVRMKNMETLVDSRSGYVDFNWSANVRNQEKIVDQFNGSAIYYKYYQDDVDELSDNDEEEEKLASKVKWVSFKQRFFSMSIIADDAFTNGEIKQYFMPSNDPKYEMTMSTVLGIPVSNSNTRDSRDSGYTPLFKFKYVSI